MKNILTKSAIIYSLLIFCSSGSIGHYQNDQKQPNIIFFLVDDMGWQDTSVPFWTEKRHLICFTKRRIWKKWPQMG